MRALTMALCLLAAPASADVTRAVIQIAVRVAAARAAAEGMCCNNGIAITL